MDAETLNTTASAAPHIIPLSQIAMAAGFGIVAGYAIGFALKKIFLFCMFFFGFALFVVIFCQYNGWIPSVNWEAISTSFDTFAATGRAGLINLFEFAVANIPGAAGGVGGLIAAWKLH